MRVLFHMASVEKRELECYDMHKIQLGFVKITLQCTKCSGKHKQLRVDLDVVLNSRFIRLERIVI